MELGFVPSVTADLSFRVNPAQRVPEGLVGGLEFLEDKDF